MKEEKLKLVDTGQKNICLGPDQDYENETRTKTVSENRKISTSLVLRFFSEN